MNNSINLQPISFGMAHRIENLQEFRKAVNTLIPEERIKLAQEIKDAIEALKDTRFADVDTFVSEGRILHQCSLSAPELDENGNVTIRFDSTLTATDNLPQNVSAALGYDAEKEKDEQSLHAFDFLNDNQL